MEKSRGHRVLLQKRHKSDIGRVSFNTPKGGNASGFNTELWGKTRVPDATFFFIFKELFAEFNTPRVMFSYLVCLLLGKAFYYET